ncbi:ankyrin repeat-containing [Trichoderma arundinaceum]|uniref:Ankyrin repeat-containing n=1 Tax=Trichoderma arundinaceum TaxID=490622 RepID=A0A395NEB1_TRIAR|nr:ankyrin repeat-containing [Trichoderma arundinaceum]
MPQESHRILAEICIWHLLFADFEVRLVDEIEVYCNSHVFLDYSAKNWTIHLCESLIGVKNPPTQSMLKLCDTASSRCQNWFMIYWRSTNTDFSRGFDSLMVASYFGLTNVTKLILRRDNIDLNVKDSRYERSALSWAAGNGFQDSVELLIEGTYRRWKGFKLPMKAGAQVDSVDRNAFTPLSHAVLNGHVDATKLLLKAGARADARDSIGGTPLDYANYNGNEHLLQLLFMSGDQVASENDISTRVLMSAVEKGNEDIVKLLLDRRKADPNSKDAKGGTLLSLVIKVSLHSLSKSWGTRSR